MKICVSCARLYYKQHRDYVFCPYCGNRLEVYKKEPKPKKEPKKEPKKNQPKLSEADRWVLSVERSVERYRILNEDYYYLETSYDKKRYEMIRSNM